MGHPAEPLPVSTYGGSSRTLKDRPNGAADPDFRGTLLWFLDRSKFAKRSAGLVRGRGGAGWGCENAR